ncbi:hydrolase [Thalassospira mesophila]|uniref:Hydrolase n=1 Tax=Thalassospira mesophila TaxID=1293891 RepID=A0A1Y2L289_9PROT|nr:hydrolase [Thalassospira mesophila]
MRVRALTFVFVLSLYFAFVLNFALLRHFYEILSALDNFSIGFAISIPLVLIAALNFVFIPFSSRYTLKPFFVLVLITGAMVSFAMVKYRIVFDRAMIQNVFETNSREAGSYVNAHSIAMVVLMGVVPAILIMFVQVIPAERWYKGLLHRVGAMVCFLVVVAGFVGFYYQDYASVGRNNRELAKEVVPENYIASTIKFVKRRYLASKVPFKTIGDDAHQLSRASTAKPKLFFLVIGETARAANYAVNGYDRATNPFTSKIDNLVSFQNVRSCGTATAISVPCMFSPDNRDGFDTDRARNSEGLLDVVHKAGVSVFWKENDDGCKGVCNRIPHMTLNPADYPDLCEGNSCHDEAMLRNIDQQIADMKGNGDKLVGLHLIGSHGPTYFKRYPDAFRTFTPDCPRSDIENCSHEELVNSYDNTIRYTDYVVSQLVAKLASYQDRYDTGLIYLSDHGESLGEMGIYLHGTPYRFAPDEQTHVPFQMWLSDGFARDQKIDMKCLNKIGQNGTYSQDNIFSTILGAFNVQTGLYHKKQDIFADCQSADMAGRTTVIQ